MLMNENDLDKDIYDNIQTEYDKIGDNNDGDDEDDEGEEEEGDDQNTGNDEEEMKTQLDRFLFS